MSTTTSQDTAEQAVRAVIDSVSAAWVDNDVAAFVAHYADDATAVLPEVALLSRAVIRTAMAAAFAGQLKGTRRVHRVQGVRFLDDVTAIVISRSVTVDVGENEPGADRWSIATWVLSGRSGRWLIEAYHDCPAA
ncbi:SgcJ/EcaC family oxidoreductase [Micromonospora arborensis]|uniref:SgcJ/EcaC family oxidoreductase n=1 Tax=Micromonospora arborensis TaxID=2116518 RepID=UPI003437061F